MENENKDVLTIDVSTGTEQKLVVLPFYCSDGLYYYKVFSKEKALQVSNTVLAKSIREVHSTLPFEDHYSVIEEKEFLRVYLKTANLFNSII